MATCSDRQPPVPAASIDSPSPQAASAPATTASPNNDVRARLRSLREHFPSVLGSAPQNAFAPAGHGGLKAQGAAVAVELPGDAAGSVRLIDRASAVSVDFALAGAGHAPIGVADGLVLYRAGAPSGGDVVHRVTDAGTEDFVYFASKPAEEALRYSVEVGAAAGLRLVANTLEFLDVAGTPRLRIAPPEVIDDAGRHVSARLAVEGCAFDTSPLPPWGRPVVAAGARACTVVVMWSAIRYPALVDPAWQGTGNMVAPRSFAAIASVPNPVPPHTGAAWMLVAGGFSPSGTPLSSAELFDPLSRTFSPTGAMSTGRAAFSATSIPGSGPGYVLVAGGAVGVANAAVPEQLAIDASGTSLSTEIYDPVSGTFFPGPAMKHARFLHTATPLTAGAVLVAGGLGDDQQQPTNAFEVITFTLGTATGTPLVLPSTTVTGTMTLGRYAHAAALLNDGNVLVTGGVIATNGTTTFKAELFCVTGSCTKNQFAAVPGQMSAGRAFHTATALSDGNVLVVGGINALSGGATSGTADLYLAANNGFQPSAISMSAPRAFHTATLLTPPMVSGGATSKVVEVVVAGGYDTTSNDLATTEAYAPGDQSFVAMANPGMVNARRHAVAALVSAGQSAQAGNGVLVAGGGFAGTTLNKAEVLVKPIADTCQVNGECLSGYCADGFCCNTACDQECFTCAAANKASGADAGASANGICGPRATTFALPVACSFDVATNDYVEVHNYCDGAGHATPGAGTHGCKGGTCGADHHCSTGCRTSVDCAGTGWCNLDAGTIDVGASDAGVADSGSPAGDGGADAGADFDASASDSGSDAGAAADGGDGGASDAGLGTDASTGDAGTTTDAGASNDAGTESDASTDAGAPGRCAPKNPTGTACGSHEECQSDHCVDGICCNSNCTGQCQACDLPGFLGTCLGVGSVAAPSAPHTNALGAFQRAACNGEGTRCAGSCVGSTKANACQYPDSTTFATDADCTDVDGGASTFLTYPCAGDGNHATTPSTCDGFKCAGVHACKTTCATDTDCVKDHVCVTSDAGTPTCALLDGPLCDGIATLRRPSSLGVNEDCANHFACPTSAKACLTSCDSIVDCAPGFACNGEHKCVTGPKAMVLSDCSVRGGPRNKASRDTAFILAVSALAFFARRRRTSQAR